MRGAIGWNDVTKAVTAEPYTVALTNQDWRLLRLLHAKGVPLGPPGLGLVVRAIQAGAPAAVLQWLVAEAGCRGVDWCAALAAAEEQCEALRCSGPRHAEEVRAWVRARRGVCHMDLWRWLQLRSSRVGHAAALRVYRNGGERARDEQGGLVAAAVYGLAGLLSATAAAAWLASP
ncbi:hypothetical protein HYH03_009028 [Edaphochlamys debaryana]|uniref:Uncharacterized protein n=1 Tax=Edaphochlamys debaryana TaxID=47281 RepID=A0A836BY46_9CHLO|nr:hypothetical protein HYH03_009028 [Edaphochlamys debaryana]|eukprot:KAG2492612.1 hypothetical protein HYH03_009028 [Edaphochlamys debaryana]